MPAAPSAPTPRRTPASVVLVVGLFFAALGGAMLFATAKLYLKQREFRSHSEHAVGTVVAFEQSIVSDRQTQYQRRTFYAPVFTFTDGSGGTRRVTSKTSQGDKPGYPVGQTLPILYNRDHPDEAELDTFFASWGGPTILGGMSLVFFALGGGVAVSGVRTMLRRSGGGLPRDPTILSGP